MNLKYLYILFFLAPVISCEKEGEVEIDAKLEEFLIFRDHVPLDDIIGEWEWTKTGIHGPGYGGSYSITPESQGYRSTIIFESNRIYREYIDSELVLETYYRIDSTGIREKPYQLYLLNSKPQANHFFEEEITNVRFNIYYTVDDEIFMAIIESYSDDYGDNYRWHFYTKK